MIELIKHTFNSLIIDINTFAQKGRFFTGAAFVEITNENGVNSAENPVFVELSSQNPIGTPENPTIITPGQSADFATETTLAEIDTKLSSQATAVNQDALKATQYLSQNNVQTVSFDTNTLATALATNTTRVVLTATQDCWVKLGGTATVGGSGCIFIPVGVPYPPILTTAGIVINVIKDTTAGKLNIYESI